jgi:hypothetical protein
MTISRGDARAALAAAIAAAPPRYGMAERDATEPPLSVTLARHCASCGGRLTAKRRSRAYCSAACRQKAYRRRAAP